MKNEIFHKAKISNFSPVKVLINEYERIEYYQDKILVFDKEDSSLIGEY